MTGRLEPRITVNKDFDSFEQFVREYVSDVSRSGAFVRTKDPLPIGTVVNLRFTIIMGQLEILEGVGKVVRSQEDPPGMGVVFTELSKYSAALLERLLTHDDEDD